MSHTPSILDVAREARVAPSTVSLVMNHQDRVKPETRQRVRKVIERLGYRGRRRGPKAHSVREVNIAFLYMQETFDGSKPNIYGREIIAGAKAVIGAGRGTLSILRGLEHIDKDEIFREQVEAGDFDAVVAFGARATDGYVQYLQQSPVKLVEINRPSLNGKHSCVTLDFRSGSRTAIEHLIDHGHRKIVTIEGINPPEWLGSQIRLGCEDAFAAAKIEPVASLMTEGGRDIDALHALCRKILKTKATAVHCGDRFAIHMIDYFRKQDISVPEDISVIGFDGLKVTTCDSKRLTSIGFDKYEMGRKVMGLIDRLTAPNPDVAWAIETVPTYLDEGDTVLENFD